MKASRRTNPALHDYLVRTMLRSSQNSNNSMAMAAAMYMGRQQYPREMRQDGVLQRMQTIDQHVVEQNGNQR